MTDPRQESIKKLKELVEGIDFCMMTTIDGGQLRCRPMSTQVAEFDAEVWFFTSEKTHKIDEIAKDDRVCLGYSDPDDNTYVSVSGRAEMSKDRAKMEELWNPILKAWFPDGLDDPDICLMKVTAEKGEYWEASSGKLVELYSFAKALVTGQQADYGENRKLEL
jgi:general stress protein 26